MGAPNRYGGRRMTAGGAKSPKNITSFFFNTVHLLPNGLKFEHEGAKLASCPWRHQTSFHPCLIIYSFSIIRDKMTALNMHLYFFALQVYFIFCNSG